MKEDEQLKLENKKLKEEVKMFKNAYENILTEKILIEQEYKNYKESIGEKMKIKNQGIYGNISKKTDNTKINQKKMKLRKSSGN